MLLRGAGPLLDLVQEDCLAQEVRLAQEDPRCVARQGIVVLLELAAQTAEEDHEARLDRKEPRERVGRQGQKESLARAVRMESASAASQARQEPKVNRGSREFKEFLESQLLFIQRSIARGKRGWSGSHAANHALVVVAILKTKKRR